MKIVSLFIICLLAFPLTHVSAQSESIKEIVSFSTPVSSLEGYLVRPVNLSSVPVIIFVHGDGPIDRTMFGAYLPIWERFTDAGYACLSWDKPGTGNSSSKTEGYVQQSIPERVQEIIAAYDYLASRNDIEMSNIGLWGISQAGWVMPRADLERSFSFMIFVSCPTTTAEMQSAYLIRKNLLTLGHSSSLSEIISEAYYNSMVCLNSGRPYHEYQRFSAVYDTVQFIRNLGWFMTEEEYTQEQLSPKEFYDPGPLISQITCPLLVIYGDLDSQVDPLRGMQDFSEYLRDSSVPNYHLELIPNANHAIWQARDGSLTELVELLQSGDYEYSRRYLELMNDWITSLLQ